MTEDNGASGADDGKGGDEGDKEKFAIPDKVQEEPKTILTVEGAKEAGWSDEEIKMGEEQKSFSVVDLADKEKKEAEAEEEKKKADLAAGKGTLAEKPPPQKKKGEDFALNADEEKEFSKAFPDGHNVHGLYFHGKSQRNRAQAAEAERDRLIAENAENKERIKELETAKTKEVDPTEEEDDGTPLTRKQMKEMLIADREDQAKLRQKTEDETNVRSEKIKNALTNQENHAKNVYSDYDAVTNLGAQLFERDDKGQFKNEVNVGSLPEGKRKKAMLLVRQMHVAAKNAASLTTSDYTASDIAYELGQLHPDFGKDPSEKPAGQSADKSNGNKPERTRGGLTPEEVNQIERNSQRRGSSASLSGAKGHKFVTVEDITVDDLNAMDTKTFNEFSQKHPGKVEELSRG